MGTPAPEPRRVLAGRYRLDERLGAGGMGAIWRAEHLALQAPVAVKLIDRDAVPDEETLARFLREAKAAAALRSPHVVQILDYGVDDRVPFIVMELLEGETLSQRLKRLKRLTPADTARFVSHIGRAVGRAHDAGIVHRDLKPDNVFLVHNEDEEIAKVLDFGVAKVDSGTLGTDETRTRTGSILGTPYYMSPEQAQGNKAVDHRSDLWSLGVIAFECLTGRRPFYSDGLGDLVLQICVRDIPVPSDIASVPIGFDDWFARATSRETDKRFQSAREMTDALREALGVDSREAQSTMPEIVVSSSPKASSERFDDAPRSSSSAAPDPNAPTVEFGPGEQQRLANSGISAARVPIDDGGSGLGSVVAVAAVALGLGLGGGLFALGKLQFPGPTAAEQPDAGVSALLTAAAKVKRPPARVEAPPPASADPAVLADAGAAPATSAEPLTSGSAAHPVVPGPLPRPKRDETADAGIETGRVTDGGYVKPSWAIPDEEPHRAPPVDEPAEP